MKVSVIICTRNRFEDFRNTVLSLAKQIRLPDELIIVDSSDELRIEAYLDTVQLPFPILYFYTQPGLTLQRNRGIHECKGELVLFFDDDVDLGIHYLEEVEKVFVQDVNCEIGAVGGRIVEAKSNRPQTLRFRLEGWVFRAIRLFFGLVDNRRGRFNWSGMPTHPHTALQSGFIECLSGCCMAFRREVFNKAAFDESLARYGLMEDVDISKQVLDAGYKIYYQTAATLVHNESPINRLNVQQWAEMSVINYDYLFRKSWSKEKWRWIFYYWAMLGLIIYNFHSLNGLKGTFTGLKKVFEK